VAGTKSKKMCGWDRNAWSETKMVTEPNLLVRSKDTNVLRISFHIIQSRSQIY